MERKVLFIAGSGRSGTSTLARTLQILGMHVPQPEITPDHTNPKGFGESRWVVDFHDRLLRRANVRVADARPQAWLDTGRLNNGEKHRERLRAWLDGQCRPDTPELVIKDPRLAWFLGLWRSAALRCELETAHAVMLRPPAEVLASKQTYYPSTLGDGSRAASWLNHMLHTERATRGLPRAFVSYHALLEDWTVPVHQLGEQLGLSAVRRASARDIRSVHEFVDPSLRRVRTQDEDLRLPIRLRVLVHETWEQLSRLTEPDADDAKAHASLDELRQSYVELYQEAEDVASCSAIAAQRKAMAEARAAARKPPAGTRPADNVETVETVDRTRKPARAVPPARRALATLRAHINGR